MSDKPDEDPTIALARNMVRKNQLLSILDALHEIGSNRENRAADRVNAMKALLAFVEPADGGGKKADKMPSHIAKALAKLGAQNERDAGKAKPSKADGGSPLLQDEKAGQRVADSATDGGQDGEDGD
jgi:hypothetical protein